MKTGATPHDATPDAAATDTPTCGLVPVMNRRHWLGSMGAFVFSLGAGGCGGGVGEEGTGAAPETVSVGVLKGIDEQSVTVNGVTYDRAQAQTVDGFDTAAGSDALRLGVWIEVQGTYDEASNRGVARTLRIRPALRGVVSTADANEILLPLLDATVKLNKSTVIDGIASLTGLVAGDAVEVHGPLGGVAGNIAASRVEKLAQLPVAQSYELRGRVSNLDTLAKTLTVGRRAVSYATALVKLRTTLTNGMVVRVSSTTAPSTTQPWVVDRLVADQVLPDNLGFLYAEGLVSEFAAGPVFRIENLPVDARGANNKAAITGDGQRVAVVGALVQGTLIAKAVAVAQPGEDVVFILSGKVTDFVSLAEFKVRNVSIDASTARLLSSLTGPVVADGNTVRVQGTVQGRRLIATEVLRLL